MEVLAKSLHAFAGVAELKLGAPEGWQDHLPEGLHAFAGVAELKRGERAEVDAVPLPVSTPSPAWPN